ncbi:sugar dehydrogenase complex small subunit [Marinibaculum pumilum]|uniref:Sugar dehydrogenase complex small subunit n=1 Tax=Marinibaculum pumilum TaxID=1766165 RepID=A0ABV7L7U7_9PROT
MAPIATAVMTRRRMLGLSAGLAAAASIDLPLRSALAAPALDVDAFLALSARLTGRDATDLDPEVGAGILQALQDQGHGGALAALAAESAPAGPLADGIVAAWYSGIAGSGAAARLVTYTDALLWGPLTFTKPGGWCGGATGYWSEPPEA